MADIELLTAANFSEKSLDSYERRHEVKKVYRRTDGGYALVEQPYVEDWNLVRRREIANKISGSDYVTYVAVEDGKVVGLKKQLVGNRMILDMMHVSAALRGKGLGHRLFEKGRTEARKAGADELYISACSSEETVAFYRAMGAKITDSPIKEMAEEEPFDLQMTCKV